MTAQASEGIDPQVVRALETVWGHLRGSWRTEDPVFLPPWSAPHGASAPSAGAVAVLPVFDGDALVAVLYLDRMELAPALLERLTRLARALDRSARLDGEPVSSPPEGWQSYLESTGLQDLARERLLILLRRNEWNISRVARIMDVTRRTIYQQLRRYAIPRERVAKSEPRARASLLSPGERPPRPGPRSRR